VDLRKERVVLETDRHRVHGAMTLPSEGSRSRLSDHVNSGALDFFAVTDAVVTPFDGAEGWSAPVLMVGRHHIRLIVLDDPKSPGS